MISWDTDVRYCAGQIVDEDTGRTVLVQSDWDYPGVASSFGWSLENVQCCPNCGAVYTDSSGEWPECEECCLALRNCPHDRTDGTVDCPDCGISASDFIRCAGEWLDDNDGVTADDPGYFDGAGFDDAPYFDEGL